MDDINAVKLRLELTKEDFDKYQSIICVKISQYHLLITSLSVGITLFIIYNFWDTLNLISRSIFQQPSEKLVEFSSLVLSLILVQIIKYLLLKFFSKYTDTQYIAPNGIFLRPMDNVFDKNGIYSKSEYVESTFSWQSIIDVENHADMILLYVDEISALVIPKRYFENDAQATQFFHQVKSYWQHSKNKTGKNPWGQPTGDSAQVAITTQDKDNNESGI